MTPDQNAGEPIPGKRLDFTEDERLMLEKWPLLVPKVHRDALCRAGEKMAIVLRQRLAAAIEEDVAPDPEVESALQVWNEARNAVYRDEQPQDQHGTPPADARGIDPYGMDGYVG